MKAVQRYKFSPYVMLLTSSSDAMYNMISLTLLYILYVKRVNPMSSHQMKKMITSNAWSKIDCGVED